MYCQNLKSLTGAGLLCLLTIILQLNRAQGEVKLDSLCNDAKLSLTKISEVRRLIQENKSTGEEKCNKFSDSLNELDDILATVQKGHICNLDFVDNIRKYHESFIASSNNKARDNIPKSLRYFFIALCFQISARCKTLLINDLEIDTASVITESDYKEIDFLEAYGITLFDYETKIKDFDDILLLNDLNSAKLNSAEQDQDQDQGRLLIKVKTNNMMRRLVANCNNKFKPFYDKLIIPLIKLSNLGYNYQGELMERELEELNSNSLILRWYNIVQTCEAFRTIQIYEEPEVEGLSEGRKAITFISPSEAEYLHKNNVKTIEEEIKLDNSLNEKIVYEPEIENRDDELWIMDQKELDKLVANYKSSKSEADRVRAKFFKKLMAKLKETIMSGKVLMLAQDLVKTRLNNDNNLETTNVNEEFIMLMDKAVENDGILNNEASLDELETPVAAGFKNFMTGSRIVSKSGGALRLKPTSDLPPPRAKLVLPQKDGTKLSTRFLNFTTSFLPRKMDIFITMLSIAGFLLIIIAIFSG